MRIISAALLALCLFGCSPQKRIARIYMRHPELRPKESDSVKTWITYTCDSFPLYIKEEVVRLDTNGILPIDLEFKSVKKSGRLTESVVIHKGKLTVICHEDSLNMEVEYWKAEYHESKTHKTVITVTDFKEHWYSKFLIYWFWITAFIVLCLIVMKIIKYYVRG